MYLLLSVTILTIPKLHKWLPHKQKVGTSWKGGGIEIGGKVIDFEF